MIVRRHLNAWIVVLSTATLCMLALIMAGWAPGTVRADPELLFVAPGGSGTACSQGEPCALQDGLDRATDGDTLYMAQGTYTGTGGAVITLTKTITLCGGWDGAPTGPPVRYPPGFPTSLNAQGSRRIVYITGDVSPTLDGLLLSGGNATSGPDAGLGGGIYSVGASPRIVGCNVSGSIASNEPGVSGRGGGIYIKSAPASAVISGSIVAYNTAAVGQNGYGGGVALVDSPMAQLFNNMVLSNTASITGGLGYGGGIAILGSADCVLRDNRVEYNVAQQGTAGWFGSHGGGIYGRSSDRLILEKNQIRFNLASLPANGEGGGVALWICRQALLQANLIRGNIGSAGRSGTGRGGGFSAYGCTSLLLDANSILNNTAQIQGHSGFGGGLYLSRATFITMTNNIVAANHASYQGGAIAFETGGPSEPVVGWLFHNTFAMNDGGDGDVGRSAIYIDQPHVTLALTNNIIHRHSYGVYVGPDSSATLHATLFFSNTAGDIGGPGSIVNSAPVTGENPLLGDAYHLRAGSPAIDRGSNAGVTVDIDGDSRPQGSGYDIGADEFVSAATPTPTATPSPTPSPTPEWRLYLPALFKS